MMGDEILEEGLKQLNLPYQSLLPKLKAYLDILEKENERFGLVKFADRDELIIKHVLDSLTPWESFANNPTKEWADVGSGAGFPGIPLALAFPDKNFTLIERSGKRARFLILALERLQVKNLFLLDKPYEESKKNFSALTFRAFSPLNTDLIKVLKGSLLPGGRIYAYKGRKAVFEEELKSIANLIDLVEIKSLQVPFLDEERHLVSFSLRKI